MRLSSSNLFLSLAVLSFCFFVQRGRATAANCPKRTDNDGRCKKPCRTDNDCKRRKKCLCDGPCGLSCIRTGQQCRTDYYDVPRGGKRTVNGLNFGDTVKYSCKRGLTLYGPTVLTCSGIRKWKPWDQGEPKCKRTCPDPGSPKDGRRIGNNFEVRKGVRFICNPGYDMEGPSMIICTRSLRWNGRVPICKVASCSAPQLPSRASIRRGKQDSYIYGDIIYLTCSRGYALFRNSISRCLTNGWSNVKVRCLPKSCGHPGYLTNGQVIGHIFTYRSIVRYKCNRGYRLKGAASRICLHNQNWGGSLPRCEEKTCTSLPVIENGRFEGFSSKVGASKIAKCDSGYKLVGATSITCSEDGWKFNGKKPKCLDLSRECENIRSILNGKPKRTILFEGDTLEYECNHRYQLEKRGEQKCRSGRITGTYPRCIVKECRMPVDPHKGKAVDKSYDDYDYAVYHCNKGYELEGSRQRCVNAKWIGSIPICKVQSCHHPGSLPNGELHGRSFTYGSIVIYTCAAGYELRGSNTRKCLENKLWSGNVPRCIEIIQKCMRVSPPLHGYLSTWGTEIGVTVTFTCKQGYDLDGAKQIECRRGGHWSSDVPKCVQDIGAQRCPILRVPQHGIVSPNADRFEAKIGLKVTFTCMQGYIEDGAKEMECKQGGRWSSDVPKCLQDHVASRHKGCWHENHYNRALTLEFKGMTPYAPNGHVEQCIVGCGDLHQSYAGIEKDKCFCGNDYRKHGKGWEDQCYCKDTKQRKCGGTWRMSVYETGCRKPKDPINGKAVDIFYSSGHRGKYKCNDRLVIKGNGQVCDGLKWSGSIPKCEQDSTCSDSFADENLDIIAPNFDDGTKGIYRCKGYHLLHGNEVTVCKDRRWTGNPRCLAPCATDLVGNYTYSSKHRLSASTAKMNCPEITSNGAKERTFKCNDGLWILEHETDCKIYKEKSCPPPPILANTIQERQNDRVRYRCMNGYERKKRHRNRFLLKCVNGEWKGSAKKCQRSSSWCSANVSYPLKAAEPVVRHARPQTFYCDTSFELSGSGVLLCNRGRVEGTFPKCEKNGCPSCNSDKKSVIDLCHESDVVFIATANFMTQIGVVVIPKTILKLSDNLTEFQKEQFAKKVPTVVKQSGTGQCQCPSIKLKKDYLMFKTGSSQTFKAMPLELSNKNPKRATSQLAYYCKRGPR